MGLVPLQLMEAVACVCFGLSILSRTTRVHTGLDQLITTRKGARLTHLAHLWTLELQRRLQDVPELTQLLPLAVVILFNLQRSQS